MIAALLNWYLGRRRLRVEAQLRRIRQYHGAKP